MNNDIAKDVAELLPCPFCGKPPMLDGIPDFWMVSCRSGSCCNPETGSFLTKEGAVKLWNTRATAADKERIASLERSLNEANANHEKFERLWYLEQDKLAAKTQECEGLLYLLEGTVYMGSWDLKQQGEWEKERDKYLADDSARKEGA